MSFNEKQWQRHIAEQDQRLTIEANRDKAKHDAGKVGPEIKTHDRLAELLEAKRAVYWNRSVVPVAVVMNFNYSLVCHLLKNGYLKEYDPKGGFKK
jgi:hypothetical protein